MLSQMQKLSIQAEGRYASDEELRFIPEYLKTYNLRFQTYQKLQEIEKTVLQQVQERLMAQDPSILRKGEIDLSAKCKSDTMRTWRYSAAALLVDDTEALNEQLLFWLQTIIRACNKQKSYYATYSAMQEVVKQHLTLEERNLFMPILEIHCRLVRDL